jgi:hypothetical protein
MDGAHRRRTCGRARFALCHRRRRDTTERAHFKHHRWRRLRDGSGCRRDALGLLRCRARTHRPCWRAVRDLARNRVVAPGLGQARHVTYERPACGRRRRAAPRHRRREHPRMPGGGRRALGVVPGAGGVRRPGKLRRALAAGTGGVAQVRPAHLSHPTRRIPPFRLCHDRQFRRPDRGVVDVHQDRNELVTLVTLGFLSFFFLYLLRLLNVINKPFKVGQERGDDDVSLFLLYEFVVHARTADKDLTTEEVVEIAEQIEEAETATVDADEVAGTSRPTEVAAPCSPASALESQAHPRSRGTRKLR